VNDAALNGITLYFEVVQIDVRNPGALPVRTSNSIAISFSN
jgi:hypothetical protein